MTEPLVPAEVDLRDFRFMPVEIARLFNSSFHAYATDAEWRAGVTLWLKSWHQVPAASLPSDDVALCRLAELGRDLAAWESIKAGALRGWQEGDDGRLYHPVVAEKALEAWSGRQGYRERTAKARAERERRRAAAQHPVTDSVTDSDSVSVTDHKGEGEGQGEGQGQGDSTGGAASPTPPAAKAPRGSRLPQDWTPGEEGADFARGLGLDPNRVFASFRDFWSAAAGAKGLKADWLATWRNWCRKEADRRPGGAGGRSGPSSVMQAGRQVLDALDRREGGQ